jgi:outer membrane biogenesis lipoprotein LolB
MNRFLVRGIFVLMICLSSSLTLVSCKAKAKVATVNKRTDTNRMDAERIIKNHYANKSDFTTLYIKSNVKYSDEKQTQNVTAEIKIKKNEQILVSIRFLGITMAKALITPTLVSYYEKMGGTYFEGDFSSLSQWLGTDLDYNKVQNILIGQAMDDLTIGNYQDSLVDQTYRLENISKNNTKKYFFFDKDKFLLDKQEITQIAENRKIEVSYSDYKTFNESPIPSNIAINAEQQKGKTEINLEYNTVTINEQLTFPYNVPNGYKRILIK